MIARIWHGKTNASKADDYMKFLEKTGIPDYRGTQGSLACTYCARSMAARPTFCS